MRERILALDRHIEAAMLERELHAKWEHQLNGIKTELRHAEAEVEQLLLQWQEEKKDVERLTNRSLSNLFYTLIGTKEQKLSEEQIEELKAKERYELALSEANALEEDRAELSRKLIDVSRWDTKLKQAMQEKEELLREHDSAFASALDELQQQKVKLLHEKKELGEARAAGEHALRALRRAGESFDSAKNWSTYDMLGGGMLATHIKHSRIDEAQESVTKANHALRTFQRELKDVEQAAAGTDLVHIEGGLKFADYFLDGLIADWMVNNRIQSSLEAVNKGITRVEPILKRLNEYRIQVEGSLQEATRRYDQLILTYKM
ncbi:hypothetical protein [Paenibacillus aquistagni]|uniref:hypothetical protein n=1 Tax=Paenibacillus aquistagni TaxID=1852522 RepID=UPI00145A35D4|nr:hypothetical protein [Paenibacillus aquistagni]NMM52525.1 hypothetical protein [Paenibacillus aquistagni]